METAVPEFTEKRSGAERRKTIKDVKGEAQEKKKHNVLLEVLGSIVMAGLGLYVYKATGLYSAADAGIVHVALGGGIAWYFVSVFRHAIYH